VEGPGIEEQAERALDAVPTWLWDGATLPVPVERIADSHFGLLVREVGDLAAAPGAPALGAGQTFSGLLLPDAGEIWVNASEAREWPTRRRFTIGHELGHWCMHRTGGAGAVYCRAASVAEAAAIAVEDVVPAASPVLPNPPRPPQEDEANLFGAALLMPARLLRERYARDRDFEGLRELFDVSGAALGRRLHAVI